MATCSTINNSVPSNLVSRARFLSIFTIFYNLIEGFASIYFGIEDESISLLGFGLDSFVEVASAVIVLMKLKNQNPDLNLSHERRATFLIGLLFILLGFSVVGTAGYALYTGSHPETTKAGIVISVLSLSFMFFLWRSKAEIGIKMNSSTVMADAKCSLACIKLSVILFVGSLVYWLWPILWWVDSSVALVLGFLIFREGYELVQNSRKPEFQGGCGCH
ncbi:MAG TPA: cation transporter [Bacteriovoracaceae bacterium]|nr:cation transporter [Bacteriovoracaceae bacterium]